MLLRSRVFLGDFRTGKLVEEFTVAGSSGLVSTRQKYDHVAIDVGPFAGAAARFTKGLLGSDRDAEMLRHLPKLIFGAILKKFPAKKSIALFMDGSDPLWKVRKLRVFPGKRFESRFYRGCCPPIAFQVEERLRTQLCEHARQLNLPEFVVSGPSVPGPVEAKMSAWLFDLASRIDRNVPLTPEEKAQAISLVPGRPPAHSAFVDVDANDSMVLIGQEETFLSALGATPFHNITTVIQDQREIRCLNFDEGLEWLGLQNLAQTVAGGAVTNTGSEAPSSVECRGSDTGREELAMSPRETLARVRCDAVLLHLLGTGCTATDLHAVASLNDLLNAYHSVMHFDRLEQGKESQKPITCITKDSEVSNEGGDICARVGIDFARLEQVLSRALKKPVVHGREDSAAADYLEILMQTFAMYCDGGIKNYAFIPKSPLSENTSTLRIENLVSHLQFLSRSSMSASRARPAGGGTRTEVAVPAAPTSASRTPFIRFPSIDRDFALTPIEQLLLSFTNSTETVRQILPAYTGGHQIPEELLSEIVNAKEFSDAVTLTRDMCSYINPQTHAAARYEPSYYFYRTQLVTRQAIVGGTATRAHTAPMFGYEFAPVNIGLRSAELGTTPSYAAAANGGQANGAATAAAKFEGASARNTIVAFDGNEWTPRRTAELPQAAESTAHPDTLRVLTWNVQFDRHSGEKTPLGRPGVDWCTPTRYYALSDELRRLRPDIVGMQEVEPAWWEFLAKQPWVREEYYLTCQAASNVLQPYGQLMMVRKTACSVISLTHESVSGFTGHRNFMPVLTVRWSPPGAPRGSGGGGGSGGVLVFSCVHLLAPYNKNNIEVRKTQLESLVKVIPRQERQAARAAPGGVATSVVLGDFNDFSGSYFSFPKEFNFSDAWLEVYPTHDAAGAGANTTMDAGDLAALRDACFTINGERNTLAGCIIEPEFFGRADRVLFTPRGGLRVLAAELVGTEPVAQMGLQEIELRRAKCPEYLFPSDHFGVLITFTLANSPRV